jgi:hypothetical protein
MAGTPGALAPLLQYESDPCIDPETTASRPAVACQPGMEAGDLLTGFWLYSVEGGLLPAAEAPASVSGAISRRLYGVFRYGNPAPPGMPEREYGIVFLDVRSSSYGLVLLDVRDGLAVSLDFYPDPELMNQPGDPAWILPPLELLPSPGAPRG